jgi:hypothetical protein
MSKKTSIQTSHAMLEVMESRRLMSYTPAGGDSLVNTYTAGSQGTESNVAANTEGTDAAGNYVVTWNSDQDGAGTEVYARAFWADGSPRTGEFRVNQTTAGYQNMAGIAMESNGDFVIVWQGPYTPPKSNTTYTDIFARRYNAAGQALGGEFLAGESSDTNGCGFPSVAMDQDGDFVVAWHATDVMVDRKTSGSRGVIAQRFNQNGQKVGANIHVNTYVPDSQSNPKVAMDAAGSAFVVTWSSLHQDGAAAWGVYAKRFAVAADGSVAPGAELKVNTLVTGVTSASLPVSFVGMRPDGGQFTIGWRSNGIDGDGLGVYARRYGAAGQPLSAQEFRVNTTTVGGQNGVQAGYDAAGNSLISWTDTGTYDVFAQAYDAQGSADGGEFPLSQSTAGEQVGAHFAFQPGGGFVAVFNNSLTDGSDVYARRFTRNVAATTTTSLFSATPVATSSFTTVKDAVASESQLLLA